MLPRTVAPPSATAPPTSSRSSPARSPPATPPSRRSSRLAVAIREDNREEVQGYAGAIDPHAVAELLVFTSGLIWGLIEVARNVLVFAPIAVTWFGLSTATDAYQKLISNSAPIW